MLNLQKIDYQSQDKYEEIQKYLKQDEEYWLKNDIWNTSEENFIFFKNASIKNLKFEIFTQERVKNEVKYYTLFNLKEKNITASTALTTFTGIGKFLTKEYNNITSIFQIINKQEAIIKLDTFLIESKPRLRENTLKQYNAVFKSICTFFEDFYDDKEEIQKDIWDVRNIKGARVPASTKTARLDFSDIPKYYREDIKRYFSTIITRKGWGTCAEYMCVTKFFFKEFYGHGYTDGFLEELSREDVEKYLYWLDNEFKEKNATYKSKFVTYIETIIEYMQLAGYITAPKKDIYKLFYHDDIPKRETNTDVINRVKYVPEPIIQQIDNHINEIENVEIMTMYMLLRETGWRGTDILNLRYHNCLEQIWNAKENKYVYYLCGEITKTGIAQLKIPLHEEIAQMVEKCIKNAKEKSTDNNNPQKYLFNTYEGKYKGRPIGRNKIIDEIEKLINTNNITDTDGELYHFRLHSLRHTRAKEYIEQGMGIVIVQQMLGHRSLQMTIHYATVSENLLYNKWKETEELQLFKLNNETNQLERMDMQEKQNDKVIRYEYVKENLDAVRVPFGICFKSQKIQCKNQLSHCLTCASFCTSTENIAEYEKEIVRVEKQIELSQKLGRTVWVNKNTEYLQLLKNILNRIKEEKVIHKNGNTREEF